jgi:hypothetical protein
VVHRLAQLAAGLVGVVVRDTDDQPSQEEGQGQDNRKRATESKASHGSENHTRRIRVPPQPFRAAQIIPSPQTIRSTGQ